MTAEAVVAAIQRIPDMLSTCAGGVEWCDQQLSEYCSIRNNYFGRCRYEDGCTCFGRTVTDKKIGSNNGPGITLALNPAVNGRTTLMIPAQAAPALVRVLDVNGRVVYTGKVQQTATLNLQSLAKGLYTVQVVTGNKTVNKKLLVE